MLRINLVLASIVFATLFNSCKEKETVKENEPKLEVVDQQQNEEEFVKALEKHLKAAENKDLVTLKTTMSPKGNMELIQPGMEVIQGVDGFMKFHEDFFKIPNFTLTFKITSKNVGNKIGIATTEALYKEPERNGKPYFNRLAVTYTLEKIDGKWYVIKDHASSIEKTKS